MDELFHDCQLLGLQLIKLDLAGEVLLLERVYLNPELLHLLGSGLSLSDALLLETISLLLQEGIVFLDRKAV